MTPRRLQAITSAQIFEVYLKFLLFSVELKLPACR